MRYVWFDLSREDWMSMLRHYRALRIRVPHASPGSPHQDGLRAEGHYYGRSRHDARRLIEDYWRELSWLSYLGSK